MKAVPTTPPTAQRTAPPEPLDPSWADEILLRGEAPGPCLVFGDPISRGELRRLVGERQAELTAVGLRRGGTVALHLAPSPALVTHLLAGWRIGAQVALLDHRLTPFEIEQAMARLEPQVLVAGDPVGGGPPRGYHDQRAAVRARPTGRPARTPDALLQLSSGSTGPSKIIGRTAADLVAEIERYSLMDGVPGPGERMVSMASTVHVLGLVGGLLHCLHAGVRLDFPGRITGEGVLATVAAAPEPTTLLGVPFHIELLSWVADPPRLPQLTGMTTGGELVRPRVHQAFTDRYGVRLGSMYGMTEVGVIATDLFGAHRPALTPAPGITLREADGELLIARERSPYFDSADPSRWSDGWLRTRDGGTVDPETGLVRVLGRLDSQVSVGGLKVDLTEVEHTLADLPEVEAAVVTFGGAVEAYVLPRDRGAGAGGSEAVARIEAALAERLAAWKRPRRLHLLERLPRTATGKPVRDPAVLRAAAQESHRPSAHEQSDRKGNQRDGH
jgi:acyl-coenzyme A synthetase/AMP-(fatty) acid ligase